MDVWILGSLISLPLTALYYWQTRSEFSLVPVIFGGIVAGYLSTRKTGGSSGVGVQVGVIGGVPVLWMLFDILVATSDLAGPAWFVTGARFLTVGHMLVLAAIGFGFAALVGSGGAKIRNWLAQT